MASVFKKDEVVQEKSVIEIIRDSLDVDGDGVVRFRSRTGRGSGKGIEIPGVQFDEFVTLMVQAQESREALAEQQRALETKTETETVTNDVADDTADENTSDTE